MPNFRLSQAEVDAWVAELKRARAQRESWANDVRRNMKLYNGDVTEWLAEMPGGRTSVAESMTFIVNLLRAYVRSAARSLTFKNPRFYGDPLIEKWWNTADDGTLVPVDANESVGRVNQFSNLLAHATNWKEESRRAIVSAWLAGRGRVKFGLPHTADLSHSFPTPVPTEHDRELVLRPEIPYGLVHHSYVTRWFPYRSYRPELRFLDDPDALTWPEVNWTSELIIRPLVSLKQDKRFADTEQLESNLSELTMNDLKLERGTDYQKPTKEPVEYHEIHYRIADPQVYGGYRHYLLGIVEQTGSLQRNTVIRHEPYPIHVGGWYYEQLQFNPSNDSLLGTPPVNDFRKLNGLLNFWYTFITDWVSRVLPTVFVNLQMLEETARTNFIKGIVMKVIGVNGDAREAASIFQPNPPPAEVFQMPGITRGALDQMSGRSPIDLLQATKASATEVEKIGMESDEQREDMLDTLGTFEANSMEKMHRLTAAIMPQGKLSLPNLGKRKTFFQIEATDLLVPMVRKMDPSSTRRKASPVERRMAQEDLASILAVPPQLIRINPKPMIEHMLIAAGYADLAAFFEVGGPEPWDPMLEHTMMLAGIVPKVYAAEQDFTQTLPAHKQWLQRVMEEPQLKAAYFKPFPPEYPAAKDGKPNAMTVLLDHIGEEEAASIAKGQGMGAGALPAGAGPGGAGAPEAGGGKDAGRMQAVPNDAEMAAAAQNVPAPPNPGMRGGG